jgi:menaquinol-cytochrome c reductase iron-sulfur subunit
MNENTTNHPTPCRPLTPAEIDRRGFFEKICVGLGALCGAILAIPIVGFVVAPLFGRVPVKWISLGKVSDFMTGKTVDVPISDPSSLPWAGISAKSALWLRKESETEFIAFSVNCTHLGCPVRWLPQAELFMCPCHGGVYYKDGSVAAGPPPKPLVRYEVRIENGQVMVKVLPIPITTTTV